MKINLNWKKKWCDDKSAHWYSAKVPIIGWEYVTDKYYNVGIDQGFVAGLYFEKYDDFLINFTRQKKLLCWHVKNIFKIQQKNLQSG